MQWWTPVSAATRLQDISMIIKDLNKIVDEPNIINLLDDDDIQKIKTQVIERFDSDQASQAEWVKCADESIKLASLKAEIKNTPFPNASNVKYPAIATATTQFAARTMPEIVRADKVAEAKVIGMDPTGELQLRANNVSTFMSYQLLFNTNEWQESTDRLLHLYSNVGTVFRKVFYDPIKNKYVFRLCKHNEVIVNNDINSIEEANAITHVYTMSLNEIMSHVRAGIFEDRQINKHDQGTTFLDSSDDELHEILEQHCFYDLDGDGYAEPYIVTIHKKTDQVLRMVARFFTRDILRNKSGEIIYIKPINMFIDYHFLPSMDGSFYSLGFGTLLHSLNHTINSLINQLNDAGRLANTQGGFLGKQLRIKGGNLNLQPGEWKLVDCIGQHRIQDNIVPMQYKEPSSTLFSLLGLLIEATKDVSSVSDILQGDQLAQNAPATSVLALIEQGLKLHNSILKRLYMSLKKELELIYRLNSVFVDPEQYAKIMNLPLELVEAQDGTVSDFNLEDLDIVPVADPNMASDAKRAAQNQYLLQFLGHPAVDDRALIIRALQGVEIPRIDEIVPEPTGQPTPDEIKQEIDIAKTQGSMEAKQEDLRIKNRRVDLEEIKIKSEAIKNLAEAEAAEAGPQLGLYKAQVDDLKASSQAVSTLAALEANSVRQGDNGRVEQSPSDNQTKEVVTEPNR